jgi:hypothetical protein
MTWHYLIGSYYRKMLTLVRHMKSNKRKLEDHTREHVFIDDTLQYILQFVSRTDHLHFMLVNSQFYNIFYYSDSGTFMRTILSLRNLTSLVTLKRIQERIDGIKSEIRAKMVNYDIYDRLHRRLGDEVLKFKGFLTSMKIRKIVFDDDDPEARYQHNSLVMDIEGVSISVSIDHMEDYQRNGNISVDVGNRYVISYRANDNGDDIDMDLAPLKSLSFNFTKSEWFRLFLLVIESLLNGGNFRQFPCEDRLKYIDEILGQ